jgi:hypothetical protein
MWGRVGALKGAAGRTAAAGAAQPAGTGHHRPGVGGTPVGLTPETPIEPQPYVHIRRDGTLATASPVSTATVSSGRAGITGRSPEIPKAFENAGPDGPAFVQDFIGHAERKTPGRMSGG